MNIKQKYTVYARRADVDDVYYTWHFSNPIEDAWHTSHPEECKGVDTFVAGQFKVARGYHSVLRAVDGDNELGEEARLEFSFHGDDAWNLAGFFPEELMQGKAVEFGKFIPTSQAIAEEAVVRVKTSMDMDGNTMGDPEWWGAGLNQHRCPKCWEGEVDNLATIVEVNRTNWRLLDATKTAYQWWDYRLVCPRCGMDRRCHR